MASNIEWTEETWNPLAGCSIVSPGCHNCYAATMANRLQAMGQDKYRSTTDEHGWTGRINLDEASLALPLKWKKPRTVFVNSMSDLFHENVPELFIDKTFAVMALANQHTFQVLTKRADRMAEYILGLTDPERLRRIMNLNVAGEEHRAGAYSLSSLAHRSNPAPFQPRTQFLAPFRNIWLGVSVEDQKRADERIPHLLRCPAIVRFLSCEPLLETIEFSDVTKRSDAITQLGKQALIGIHWVIVGGESGPGARPCKVSAVRSIIEQCRAAGVACFVKQFGARILLSNDAGCEWGRDGDVLSWEDTEQVKRFQGDLEIARLEDRKGGDPSEWPEWARVRQFPNESAVPA